MMQGGAQGASPARARIDRGAEARRIDLARDTHTLRTVQSGYGTIGSIKAREPRSKVA